MDDAKREKLGEVIRFGIVGGLATVLQYVIYLAMMPALTHFIPNMGDHSLATTANTIAYIVSFIFNFIASTRYTFKVKANAKRPLPHRQLLDADPLPQPLRRLGSSQTAGYDTHPLHLHPGKLPPGKVLPEEIRGFPKHDKRKI